MPESGQPTSFDVTVIGAGVVGCAIARKYTLLGARVLLLEKAADALDGASKANSAILHTGFDAPVGSIELACIQEGYRQYEEIHAKMNLPLDRCGAMVLAWTPEQEARLPDLMAQARTNGVDDVASLTREQILAREPNLSQAVRAGFVVPREALIDPWSAPHGYLTQALINGATFRRNTEVLSGVFDGQGWVLDTSTGPVQTTRVINAAGLYGDIVDQRLIGRADFDIRPRKGQFVVFDKTAARLARHILLPVPTATTKGIVVCRTIWGNLLVGPTAEEQQDRVNADLVPETLEMLRDKAAEILPALADEEVTTTYAGLRPACGDKEYQIRRHPENMITVGAIRSTGLSAALGIAEYIARMDETPWTPIPEPEWPAMPMLAEDQTRDWQTAGNGGILCHCERVTRREVAAAMSGPNAAKSLAGLKRRTRVTMGRCQGFYCSGALQEMTATCLKPEDAE
ncbi:NAD(P)/FAD-dependent oxidoreductase [Donghicola sp. XS_ASV15]|uniref:NAD(P)/FAD-dependent oxidoreductase n=1 Tax=Donghicola sp. XS_ASV15 TaxID=3241295 RepID=UPI003511DD28